MNKDNENIIFLQCKCELYKVKQEYKKSVESSNSKYKDDCKTIADQINIALFAFSDDFSKPKSGLKRCLLIYYKDKGIKGLACFTKKKDSIDIDQLTGFDKAGSELLSHIISKGLFECEYNTVQISAASQDKRLADYYRTTGEKITGVKGEIVNGNHVKFTKVDPNSNNLGNRFND